MLVLLTMTGCLVNTARYDERRSELTDQDGDGFPRQDDCDDADATVFPGAEERCDGVLQDCDRSVDEGAIDAPAWYPDADADGFGSAIAAAVHACEQPGGHAVDALDCDDTDPTIHPGAQETWADGFTDNDCDGELESATLRYGADAWTGVRPNGQLGRRLGALGDVTGDGRAEYLAAAAYDASAYPLGGAVFLVSGTTGGPLVGAPEMIAGGEGWYLGAALDGGPDVDSDGVPDLLVSATGYADNAGATWLVSGAAFAASSSFHPELSALTTVWGDAPASYSGAYLAFLGDVMGTGATFYAVGAPLADANGFTRAGKVGLFDAADRGVLSMSDPSVEVGGYFAEEVLGNWVTTAGDVDGDGLDDYMVSASSGDLAVILPGGDEDPILPDDALFRLTGTGAGESAECMMVGDIDEDGVREMGCIDDQSTLLLYMRLGTHPLETIDRMSATVEYREGAAGDVVLDLGDLDGDGRDETLLPVFWSPALYSAVAVVMPGEMFSPGITLDLFEAPLQAISTRDGGYGGRAVVAGDVDGDGFDDIALGGYGDVTGGTDAGGVVTIPVPR